MQTLHKIAKQMTEKPMRFIGVFCCILLLFGVVGSPLAQDISRYDNRENLTDQRGFQSALTVASLGTGDNLPSATAVLEPELTATLSAEVAGKVIQYPFKKGEFFKQGDALVEFECTIERARFEKAKARYDASAANAKAHQKLNELRSIASVDSKLARAEADQARADWQEQQAIVERCSIKAPFDGAVVESMINLHETVDAGRPVVRIISTRDLEVRMLIPSDWLVWLKQGNPMMLEVNETQKTYDATVNRINAEVDPVSRLVEVTGLLKQTDTLLRPGMTGTVYFAKADQTKTPIIPALPADGMILPDYIEPEAGPAFGPDGDTGKGVHNQNGVINTPTKTVIDGSYQGLEIEWLSIEPQNSIQSTPLDAEGKQARRIPIGIQGRIPARVL